MIFCSKHNFIFIKSIKTASTSVEVFLEQLIHDNPTHSTEFIEFLDGSLVGYRNENFLTNKEPFEDVITKRKFQNPKFCWNHMSALDIKNVLGEKSFLNALKISTIRNPYTKMISSFHNFSGYSPDHVLALKNAGQSELITKLFTNYLETHYSAKYNGVQHFSIDGKCCIDYFVRKEFIYDDLKILLNLLNVSEELLNNIPHYKKNSSLIGLHDYYTQHSLEIVNGILNDWFIFGQYQKVNQVQDIDS